VLKQEGKEKFVVVGFVFFFPLLLKKMRREIYFMSLSVIFIQLN